jgi:glycosyltransferase involved in cell wall biosynthesis
MKLGYCLQGQPYSQTAIQLEIAEWRKRGIEVEIIDIEKPLDSKIIKSRDFIICHFSYQGIYARRWGIPYAVYPHAYDIWRDQGIALKRSINSNNCKWVACESAYHKKMFEQWGIDKPLSIVYGAIDIDYYKRTKDPGDKIIAGGRLKPKKGLQYAVKGYNNITIFGKGQELDKLKVINPNATYTGFITKDQYKNLMEEAWLFVSPNIIDSNGDMDGIPATCMEAMLMELQVITTPISGIPELLPYVHLHSPEEIASGKIEIPKERNIGGRDLIRSRHNPKITVDTLQENIEKYV